MPVQINLAKPQGRVRDGVEKHWMKSLWSGEATATTQKLQKPGGSTSSKIQDFY